jgi:hypothetical protein
MSIFLINEEVHLIYLYRRFQSLLKTYEQLASLILDTIRTDIRCRTFHYLHAAMRLVSD